MAYTAWSVVFGEQPTAAKWNQLGQNDAGFKDGTNIDAGAINNTHISGVSAQKFSNPYKFLGYMNAATQAINTTAVPMACDTEVFDTNNNFDVTTNKGRYTVPVNGFYYFTGRFRSSGTVDGGYFRISLLVNGTTVRSGDLIRAAGTGSMGVMGSFVEQLTAGQYVEFGIECGAANNATGGNLNDTWFGGFLISTT